MGVHQVDNRLKVRLTDPLSDSDVAENVRTARSIDPDVDRFQITVTVVDGTAHLYGMVDSYYESNRADDIASGVRGVVDVSNHLQVDRLTPHLYDPYVDEGYFDWGEWTGYAQPAPYTTDAQIEEAVESELWWSPFVDADQVEVIVDDGVVTLTGTVDSWTERRAATENAYEGGATFVDNDLTVDVGT